MIITRITVSVIVALSVHSARGRPSPLRTILVPSNQRHDLLVGVLAAHAFAAHLSARRM
jgi:hypothetical protein